MQAPSLSSLRGDGGQVINNLANKVTSCEHP